MHFEMIAVLSGALTKGCWHTNVSFTVKMANNLFLTVTADGLLTDGATMNLRKHTSNNRSTLYNCGIKKKRGVVQQPQLLSFIGDGTRGCDWLHNL